MVVAVVILSLIIVAAIVYFVLRRYGVVDDLFGNSITNRVEKKKRIEGQIEVLKKTQKVKAQGVCDEYDAKKKEITDSTNAQINNLQAQIASLKVNKDKQCALLDEQKKVAWDKVVNDFDAKIMSKQNDVKKLSRFIDAEQKNIDDVINPDKPNVPQATKVLNESKKSK